MTNEAMVKRFLQKYAPHLDDWNVQQLAASMLPDWDPQRHTTVLRKFIKEFSPSVTDVLRYMRPPGFVSAVEGDEKTVKDAICTLAFKQLQQQLIAHGLKAESAQRAATTYAVVRFPPKPASGPGLNLP